MVFQPSGKSNLSLFGQPPDRRLSAVASFSAPRLIVPSVNRTKNFAENLRFIFAGPTVPRQFLGAPYFRDCWVGGPLPEGALGASVLWHVAFVLLLVQLWPLLPSPPRIVRPQMQLTWYSPVADLPPIISPRPISKAASPTEHPVASSVRGADAFHPRQTILNNPLRP